MKTAPTYLKLASSFLFLLVIISGSLSGSANSITPMSGEVQARRINSWLDFDFDAALPMGDARNPAVVLPANVAALLGDIPGAKRAGEMTFVPAAEFQKAAHQPLLSALLAPALNQLGNVKSFDGFSAIDMTGLIKNLPSELMEPIDSAGRRASKENFDDYRQLLQNGDIVLGAHVVNYLTWGRFNHAAIVIDAARGLLAESTAHLPTDRPGVRTIDWKTFAAGYVHIGIVRVKAGSADQISRVVRWVEDRKGKPYRWPIIQGLDKADQSRFYCSQLVWVAYKEILNLDLDADHGVLVFPDDLYYAKDYVEIIVP